MNSPWGMGNIDFNDPYGYGMGAIEGSDWDQDKFIAGGSLGVPSIGEVSDPLAYLAKNTSYTRAQLETMAIKDPAMLKRLLYTTQSGVLSKVTFQAFQNATDQQSEWRNTINDLSKIASQTQKDVLDIQYLSKGSRYAIGELNQKQQNEIEKQRQNKALMSKVGIGGALAAAAYLFFVR